MPNPAGGMASELGAFRGPGFASLDHSSGRRTTPSTNHAFAEPANADLAPTIVGCFAERASLTALRQRLSAPGELSFGVDDVPVRPLHSHPDQDSFGINLDIRSGHKPSIPDPAMEADCPRPTSVVAEGSARTALPSMTAPGMDRRAQRT
jgi:hypothetical protein